MTNPIARDVADGIDLLAVAGDDGWAFEHDGSGVAGRGVHARVAAADALPRSATSAPTSSPSGHGHSSPMRRGTS